MWIENIVSNDKDKLINFVNKLKEVAVYLYNTYRAILLNRPSSFSLECNILKD